MRAGRNFGGGSPHPTGGLHLTGIVLTGDAWRGLLALWLIIRLFRTNGTTRIDDLCAADRQYASHVHRAESAIGVPGIRTATCLKLLLVAIAKESDDGRRPLGE